MKSKKWRARGAFVLCAMLASAAPAWADTANDTFEVRARVLATCEIIAQDLDFGDYDPVVAADLEADTALSLTCTNGTEYALSMSVDGLENTAARIMHNGGEQLAYVLFRDPARTMLWGVSDGVDTLNGEGTGEPETISVYGRIPMQQAAPAGDYSDTITVTVTW